MSRCQLIYRPEAQRRAAALHQSDISNEAPNCDLQPAARRCHAESRKESASEEGPAGCKTATSCLRGVGGGGHAPGSGAFVGLRRRNFGLQSPPPPTAPPESGIFALKGA